MRSKRIRKVGVHVQADLTRLFNDCGFSRMDEQRFEGALELGELARERNATERSNASLVDITAVVLKQYLPKDPACVGMIQHFRQNTRLMLR